MVVHKWVTLHNLEPGRRYEIYVTGFTSKGDGPRSDGYFVITGTHCNQGFSFTVNVFSLGEMCTFSAVNANSAISFNNRECKKVDSLICCDRHFFCYGNERIK